MDWMHQPDTVEQSIQLNASGPIHKAHCASCDVCQFQIVGNRYKCLNCADYDLCDFCERRVHEIRQHNLQHVFIKLPREFERAEDLKLRFPNLYTGELDDDTELSDDTEETFIQRKKIAEAFENTHVVHTNIFCSQCSHPIIGSRFCCMNCQNPFNLCEACEEEKVHPSTHVFVKIYYELPPESHNITFSIPVFYEEEKIQIRKNSRNTLKFQPPLPLRPTVFQLPPRIRNIKSTDIPYLLEIECESFCTPYEERFFHHFPRKNNCLILVAQTEIVPVAGYIAVQSKNNVLEIVSLAVGSHSRRRGIGNYLMTRGLSFGEQKNCERATLHVSVFNFPAQQLYKKLGFACAGPWIKEYYSTEHEDALMMEWIIPKKQKPSFGFKLNVF